MEFGVAKYVGGKTGFGQKMSSAFGKMGAPIGQEAFVGAVMTTATITTGLQLTEMAIGLRKQFDIKSVIEQSIAAGIDAKLSKWETPDPRSTNWQYAKETFTGRAIQSLSHGAIASAVYGTPMNMGDIVSEYVGDIARDEGDQLTDKLNENGSSTNLQLVKIGLEKGGE